MSFTAPQELCNEAYRRYQAGDVATAARLCQEVLQRQPRTAEAVYLLGVIAQDAGQVAQASEQYRQATVLVPDNAVFANALGEALLILGKQADALACFRRALAARPNYARAHNSLGRVLHAQGNLAGANASFAEAVRHDPRYATAHNNLGAVVQAQGQLEPALGHFRQALKLTPNYPEAHFNLGTTLQALGDAVAAAASLREAVRLRPSYARAHFHLGQVLEQQREDYAALACYETASRLMPEDAEVQRRLGDHLLLKKDWQAALAALQRAADLEPGKPEPFARLVYAKQQIGDWRTYAADLDRLWADVEKQIAAGESTAVVPFQALTVPWPLPRLLAVARSHCDAVIRHHRVAGTLREPFTLEEKAVSTTQLRIAYLSGDFYDHPISHLIHGLFGRHDRERFKVFAYSFGPPDNSIFRQQIMRECDHFVEVGGLSIPALARRITADGIDILVDLMGHTGVNRLGTLALRPAPIQVSFLGMLGTMGAEFIDYLIGDRIVTPPEFAPHFTERLVTMPDSYLIAEPISSSLAPGQNGIGKADLRRDNGLPETGFVFCNFNSSYKIEPRTFAAWMRILTQVPGSVLWLQSNGELFENNLRREAAALGVGTERLVFTHFVPRDQHFVRHQAADLFLDTLLYNAAATASLALQAGLPVLTCLGDTFASRVGASLLHAVGLPELIAKDVEQYEHRAVELAQRPEELQCLRDKLAAQRSTAPLFDTPRFVRNLEKAYLAMWGRRASGLPPLAFEVKAKEPQRHEGHKEVSPSAKPDRAAANDGERIRELLASPAIFQSVEEMRQHRQRMEEGLAALERQRLVIHDPLMDVNSTNFYAAYHGLNDRDLQARLAALFLQATPSLAWIAPHCTQPPAPLSRPLRVGFISRFLHMHTIGEVNVGIIRNLSREVCRVILLRTPCPDHPVAGLIRDSADEVVTLAPSLRAARQEIAEQQLDVLFYTDIGMDPFTYFLAFARLAPVQCVTWGHPVTTGIPNIDYYLSSVDLEPPDAERHYTEKLVLLKSLPTHYYAPAFFPPAKTRRHFGLSEEDHLYMCPQAPFKLHPDYDVILRNILRADPQGRLFLIRSQNPEWTAQLLVRFRRTMPDVADRIQFLPHQGGQDYLHLLAVCDALLDTTHFGGGNTTYKALSVGAPIVTMPGKFARGRVTSACYRKMGITDCIATNEEDYVRIAVRLGTDPAWRQDIKARIVAARGALYEDADVLRELEEFFAAAVENKGGS
jgi:predicted O-linked N-acetylglucosamine transferase (SPINDLY family)